LIFFVNSWNRLSLLELLHISGGKNVQAKTMTDTMVVWSAAQGLNWSIGDIEAIVRRARTMIAHMRDYKRDHLEHGKQLPPAYAPLAALCNLIDFSHDDVDNDECEEPPLKRHTSILNIAARFDVAEPTDEPSVSYGVFAAFMKTNASSSSASLTSTPTPLRGTVPRQLIALSSDEGDLVAAPLSPIQCTITPEEVAAMIYGAQSAQTLPNDACAESAAKSDEQTDKLEPLEPANAEQTDELEPLKPATAEQTDKLEPLEHAIAEKKDKLEPFESEVEVVTPHSKAVDVVAIDNGAVPDAADMFDPNEHPERMPLPMPRVVEKASVDDGFAGLAEKLTDNDILTPNGAKEAIAKFKEEKEKADEAKNYRQRRPNKQGSKQHRRKNKRGRKGQQWLSQLKQQTMS
jgi:hypothetical protein